MKFLLYFILYLMLISCSKRSSNNLIIFSIKNTSEIIDSVSLIIQLDNTIVFKDEVAYSDISEKSFLVEKYIPKTSDSVKIKVFIPDFSLQYDTTFLNESDKIMYCTFKYDSIVKSEVQINDEEIFFLLAYPDSVFIPEKVIKKPRSISVLLDDL